MDLKFIFNPVCITVTYSDSDNIYAVAMDHDLKKIAGFQHRMSRSKTGIAKKIYHILFPFVLSLQRENTHYINININGSWYGYIGLLIVLLTYISFIKFKKKKLDRVSVLLVACSGIYAVLGLFCVEMEGLIRGIFGEKY